MTILHAGGEYGSYQPLDGSCAEVATGGTYDATWARGSIQVASHLSYVTAHPSWPQAATYWHHAEHRFQSATAVVSTSRVARYYDGSTEVARLDMTGSAGSYVYKLYTLQSGALTLVGTTGSFGPSTRQVLDLKLKAGASGEAALYSQGTEILRVSGLNHSGWVGVTVHTLHGGITVLDSAQWSQSISSTTSTIGYKLKTIPVTGASATGGASDWTGTYADVDELATNDGDSLSSLVADDVSIFAHSTTVTGEIRAFIVTARGHKGDTGGPQSLQLASRTDSTDYFSSTHALGDGFTAEVAIWETNPDTAAYWTPEEISAVEYGLKSIA